MHHGCTVARCETPGQVDLQRSGAEGQRGGEPIRKDRLREAEDEGSKLYGEGPGACGCSLLKTVSRSSAAESGLSGRGWVGGGLGQHLNHSTSPERSSLMKCLWCSSCVSNPEEGHDSGSSRPPGWSLGPDWSQGLCGPQPGGLRSSEPWGLPRLRLSRPFFWVTDLLSPKQMTYPLCASVSASPSEDDNSGLPQRGVVRKT